MLKCGFFKNRKGISLITVLLFMLVATIAATAVYKWLHSTGKSSASRMLQTEAGQASQAGLDAVRSWMSYHAADVGALIKQFEDDGGKKTINLDAILRADASAEHNFSVYLTEVDVSVQPYRLKFVSTGQARGGSSYSQAAIFKVDGLYRAFVPDVVSTIDFDYALWAGSADYGGGNEVSSLVINGNWDGNPPTTSGHFVVTGTAKLSGNKAQLGELTCIGNDLLLGNDGISSKSVYVGRDLGRSSPWVVGGCELPVSGTVTGNVYVERDLYHGTQPLSITNNLTVKRDIHFSCDGPHRFLVGGSLECNGILNFMNWQQPFIVEKNVWIPKANGVTGSGAMGHILGNATDVTVGVNGAVANTSADIPPAGYYAYRVSDAASGVLFTTKANNVNNSPSANPPFETAISVKNDCNGLWDTLATDACGGDAKFLVEDQIKTALSAFEAKAANAACGLDNPLDYNQNGMVDVVNQCYDNLENQEDALYNGFLVLKLSSSGNSGDTKPLQGKFVFIFDNEPAGNFKIPPMQSGGSNGDMALIYLKEGKTTGMIQPTNCSVGFYYNYFIYSLATISEINGFETPNCPLKGTVYVPVKKPDGTQTCPGQMKIQGRTTLQSNQDLIKALANAKIICDATVENCGGSSSGSGGSGSSSGGTGSATMDAYYIPLSPRLRVSLQTQYASEEIIADADKNNTLDPSVIVLPRVIYLPQNPTGKLSDYYSVLALNGAASNAGAVNCERGTNGGTLPVSGNLVSNTKEPSTYLTPDIYHCEFVPTAQTLSEIPFFVYVVNDADLPPKVGLYQNALPDTLNADNEYCQDVNITSEVGANPVQVTFEVKGDNYWQIETVSGVTVSGNKYTVSVSGDLTKAISVCRSAGVGGSDEVSIEFQLLPPATIDEGYVIEDPPNDYLKWSLTGDFNIQRKPFSEKEDATTEEENFSGFPGCETYLNGSDWLAPSGGGCSFTTKNEKWICTNSKSSDITMQELVGAGYAPLPACSVFVQPGLVQNPGDAYLAYADIKLHPYTLSVVSNKSGKTAHVTGNGPPSVDTSFATDGDVRTFYRLPYIVEVSYNKSQERLRSAFCTISPLAAPTSCTHQGDGKFNVSPEGNTEINLNFVDLGDCFRDFINGFTGWNYWRVGNECSGKTCARITSVDAIEVGNNETNSPGWAQIGAGELALTGSSLTLSSPPPDYRISVVELKTYRGLIDGYLEAEMNMNWNYQGDITSPAVIFRSNGNGSSYYSVFVQGRDRPGPAGRAYSVQICDIRPGPNPNNCKAIIDLNRSGFTNNPFTLAVDFEDAGLTVTISQGGWSASGTDTTLGKTGNNRFGFAFPYGSLNATLLNFLALDLNGGTCNVDGTTLPVPTLTCQTGLIFNIGDRVAAGDLVAFDANGATCAPPAFTNPPGFAFPLAATDVGTRTAEISVGNCRYVPLGGTAIPVDPPADVNCSFEVRAADACEFRQEWCPGIDWGTGIKWGEEFSKPGTNGEARCYFLTNTDMYNNCRCDGVWGGDDCRVNSGDGGYYIYYANKGGGGQTQACIVQAKPDCVAPQLVPTATCSWNHTLHSGDIVPAPAVECSDGSQPMITKIEVTPPFSVGGGSWLDPGTDGTWLSPSVDQLDDDGPFTARVEVSKCGTKTPENGGIGTWIDCTGSVKVVSSPPGYELTSSNADVDLPAGNTVISMNLPEDWHNWVAGDCTFYCSVGTDQGDISGSVDGVPISGNYYISVKIPITSTINGYLLPITLTYPARCGISW